MARKRPVIFWQARARMKKSKETTRMRGGAGKSAGY
jgi:hypothetical protein